VADISGGNANATGGRGASDEVADGAVAVEVASSCVVASDWLFVDPGSPSIWPWQAGVSRLAGGSANAGSDAMGSEGSSETLDSAAGSDIAWAIARIGASSHASATGASARDSLETSDTRYSDSQSGHRTVVDGPTPAGTVTGFEQTGQDETQIIGNPQQ
jgi:hypothetical protein